MSEFTSEVLKLVAAIVAPVIAGYLVALLRKALQRAGLNLDAERQAKAEYLVNQAILRAEEWGAARVKAKFPTTAAQKLDRALADVLDKVPGITRAEADALIHAQLPKLGAGATGFVQAVRTAATTEPAK